MTDPFRACSACQSPVPVAAVRCPSCGEVAHTAVHSPDPGTRLARALGRRYELGEIIGHGGFALIHAAWDRDLDGEVAVKSLRPDLVLTHQLLERFRREGRALAKLRHPGVITVYSVGEREGIPFLVMPRIRGESLAEVLRRERIVPVVEVARVLREVAEALHGAHEAGLVHRDVKPDNILLEGAERRVILTDFGIARTVEAVDPRLTRTGGLLGTPRYMSPEQAAGSSRVDHRSDIYSLGVVAYEMLTSQHPSGEERVADLARPPAWSTPMEISTVRAEIPPELSSIVMRCLARDPEDRWASAADLYLALRDATPAMPRDGVPRLARMLPRWPAVALAVTGLAVFGILRPVAFPQPEPAGVHPAQPRAEARRLFEELGATGELEERAVFHLGPERSFLERNLGIPEAARWQETVLPIHHWHVRWISRDSEDRWTAALAGSTLLELEEVPPPGAGNRAAISAEEADSLAHSFLEEQGWAVENLERIRSTSRVDGSESVHELGWDTGQGVEWKRRTGEGAWAPVEVSVRLRGDRIASYRHELTLPPEAARADDFSLSVRRLGIFLLLLLAVIALVHIVRAVRHADFRWREPVLTGLIVAVASALAELVYWSEERYQMLEPGPGFGGLAVWFGRDVLVIPALDGAIVAVMLAYGEWMSRRRFPGSVREYYGLLQGRWADPGVVRGLWDGYVLAAAILAYQTLFFAGIKAVPGATGSFVEAEFTYSLGESLVPLTVPAYSLGVAFTVGAQLVFGIAFFRHLLRSTPLAVGAVAVVGGLAYLRVEPVAVGILEGAGVAVILAVGFLRTGLWSCVAAEAAYIATITGAGLLAAHGMPELVGTGWLLLGLVVATPPVWSLAAWWSHTRPAPGAAFVQPVEA